MLAQEDKICLVLILDDLEEGVRRLAQEVLAGSVHTVYLDPLHPGSVHGTVVITRRSERAQQQPARQQPEHRVQLDMVRLGSVRLV